ncbi:DUF4893 domain-containing protein [Sphingomonas sp. PB4P5]|uniref:DUF4893 domain-containing protein n=1 Tax=Parasphingomonas puruogangriensis TaxID=3096155 RepID=UPI002FC703FB
MHFRIGFGLAACAVLAACGGSERPATVSSSATADWRRVATDGDRERLRVWRRAWVEALTKARASGNTKAIVAQGALFEPDRALDVAMPPPGRYKCRVFKLGARGTATQDFTVYPYFACRVVAEGDVSSFFKESGSQRPVGLAFPDGSGRAIFLGTMMLGDEKTALDYGRDTSRDMAGIIQRVDQRRWRVILPYPRFESLLDVIEMLPAE